MAQVGGEALDGGTDGRRLVRDAGLEELRLFDDDESLEDTRAAEGAAVDGAGVVVRGAEQVAPEALGGVDGAEPAVALGVDVLADAEPPAAQVACGDEGAERVGLLAVVLAEHEGRVGRPLVAQEVVPRAPYGLLCGGQVLRVRRVVKFW